MKEESKLDDVIFSGDRREEDDLYPVKKGEEVSFVGEAIRDLKEV